MKFIIHQSIAAQKDPKLQAEAETLLCEFSVIKNNLSCEHKILNEFNAVDFESSRIRESHIVFLSGMGDVELVDKLKRLPNRPFIVWGAGALLQEQVNPLTLAIDVCVLPSKSFASQFSLMEAYSFAGFQQDPIDIASMKLFTERLSDRIRYAAFGRHASSTKVLEVEDGYELVSSLQSRERTLSEGELIERKYRDEIAQALKKNAANKVEKDKKGVGRKEKSVFDASWPFWAKVTVGAGIAAVAVVASTTVFSRK